MIISISVKNAKTLLTKTRVYIYVYILLINIYYIQKDMNHPHYVFEIIFVSAIFFLTPCLPCSSPKKQ